MSGNHGLKAGLKKVGQAIKRSPQVARKKLAGLATGGGRKKKMGGSKAYSDLPNCRENGWLHDDEAVAVGVNFDVMFLGAMEITYIPNDPQGNNDIALRAIRRVIKVSTIKEPSLLTIGASTVSLCRVSDNTVVMRHGTSRIAYSTVDPSAQRYFAYVALPREAKKSLCYVFDTKSGKKSYDLTFTCAQAFDMNFKDWQARNRAEATAALKAREEQAAAAAAAAAASSSSSNDNGNGGGGGDVDGDRVAEAAAGVADIGVSASEYEEEAEGEEEDAYLEIEALQVEKESEEELQAQADAYFAQLAAAKSMPNLLDIGVDPADYHKLAEEE